MKTAEQIRSKDFGIDLLDVWKERHDIELEKIEQYVLELLHQYPNETTIALPLNTSHIVCCKLRELGFEVKINTPGEYRSVYMSW